MDWSLLARPRGSEAAIRRRQDSLVRRLVHHAWENVPYYRRLMNQAGVRPEDIRGASDLHKIPISRKRDLQRTPMEDLTARGVDRSKCLEIPTAGSTGEPLVVLRTLREQYRLFGVRLRAQILSGLRPTDTRAKVGSPAVPTWAHRLGLFRIVNLSLTLTPEEIIRGLKKLRPDVIYGIPTMLDLIVRTARDEDLRAIRPRLVFSGAELLTPGARRRFQESLGCVVVDFYGTQELNLLAWECRECGLYHTCDDGVVVEVLGPGGLPAAPGEDGEVIATGLHSLAMPLIRYELGDVASRPADPPSCRIGFGTIGRILGRSVDFLSAPDGGLVSPFELIVPLSFLRLRRFQVVQEAPDLVVILFEPMDDAVEQRTREIEESCRVKLPNSMRLEVRVSREIPITAAGKTQLVRAWR